MILGGVRTIYHEAKTTSVYKASCKFSKPNVHKKYKSATMKSIFSLLLCIFQHLNEHYT